MSLLIRGQDEGRLTADEVCCQCIMLLTGGHVTTIDQFSNAVYALLSHPAELARLRDDPDLIKSAVEESVRYDGAVGLARRVAIWDCRTGKIVVELRGHPVTVYSVAFSPDGRLLATGSADKTVIVWDLETGNELLKLRAHVEPVRVVAFSPDGTRVASGGLDGTVRIWDLTPRPTPQ
jgi:WD40 repeat protein